MAKKEIITIGTARGPGVNVHFSVGPSGDNGRADVMLVQALLRYISNIGGKAMYFLGFPLNELPDITGICDSKTQRAIQRFQQKNAGKLLSVDGHIHPADYDGRRIRPLEPRVMTITLLHYYSSDVALHKPEPTYIDGLIGMVPELRPWLA